MLPDPNEVRRAVDDALQCPPPHLTGEALDLFKANVLAYVERYKCLPANVVEVCADRAASGERVAW